MIDLAQHIEEALKGRYVVRRELGRGSMSTVFLARDVKHDRPVALKVLHPDLGRAVGADRFLREIQATAQLQHPHILTLLDSGDADGLLYYVMPYVQGESLRDRLMWEKQLPIEDAVQICREVADALGYAHSQGMVHRDVKPENILLSDGHATVADFGLALAVHTANDDLAIEQDGMAVGTPAYMSPEQCSGAPDIDGRTDLYSLGCVLYEMLAGRPPFVGSTVESLLQQQMDAEPEPISDLRPAVLSEVSRVLDRALEKNPADRFAQASDFLAMLPFPSDVRRAAEALPTDIRPRRELMQPLGEGPRPWLGRLAYNAALILLTAGLLLAGGQWLLDSSRGESVPVPVAKVKLPGAVAVLPFTNISNDESNQVFADGVHEEILTKLAQARSLKVVSRTTVMPYRTTQKSVGEIGSELGVATLLEGSIRRVGNHVRITAQLIDTETDSHIWAETYDRRLTPENSLTVQSEVAGRIAQELQTQLRRAQTGSPEHQAQGLSSGNGPPTPIGAIALRDMSGS